MNTLIKTAGFISMLTVGWWATQQEAVRDVGTKLVERTAAFGSQLTGKAVTTKESKVTFFRLKRTLGDTFQDIQIGEGTLPKGTVVSVVPVRGIGKGKVLVEISVRAYMDAKDIEALATGKRPLP